MAMLASPRQPLQQTPPPRPPPATVAATRVSRPILARPRTRAAELQRAISKISARYRTNWPGGSSEPPSSTNTRVSHEAAAWISGRRRLGGGGIQRRESAREHVGF